MYGFAVWYPGTRTLFLARDAFGKKPLYIVHGSGWLAFASELSAIAAIPDFEPRVARDAIAEYLLLQYVPSPRAIYEDCEKLPPGGWSRFRFAENGMQRDDGRHFVFHADGRPRSQSSGAAKAEVSEAEVEARADELLPILMEATQLRLRSDVPLGAFLSGGIDSGLVVAMMRRELGVDVKSFSIGFSNSADSEHEMARESADALGTEHHESILEPDAIQMLPEIAAHLDEPLGDSSCLPTWLISRFAREQVTVALSGDGGDELFGGYGRYQIVHDKRPGWFRRLRSDLGLAAPFSPGRAYCTTIWLTFGAEEVRRLVGPSGGDLCDALIRDWVEELDDESRPLIHRLRELDARTYLPGAVLTKVDRMSMACALEVRSPFLDARVAEFSATLEPEYCYSADVPKRILRKLSSRYMPPVHVARPKLGFGLPGASWNHLDMVEMMERVLLGDESRVSAYLDMDGLRAYVDGCRRPERFSVFQVWAVLMLEHWLRAHEAKPTPVALS
jgi:asparagine synthase (glutamine-hydrolysing)